MYMIKTYSVKYKGIKLIDIVKPDTLVYVYLFVPISLLIIFCIYIYHLKCGPVESQWFWKLIA